MSKWDDFKKSVSYYADKTAQKTREITDTASLKIKLASKEADRDTEYRRLGKLMYTKLKSSEGTGAEKLTREISEAIDKLDGINAELEAIKAEIEKRKLEKEAEKAEKKEKAEGTENQKEKKEEKSKKADEIVPEKASEERNNVCCDDRSSESGKNSAE